MVYHKRFFEKKNVFQKRFSQTVFPNRFSKNGCQKRVQEESPYLSKSSWLSQFMRLCVFSNHIYVQQVLLPLCHTWQCQAQWEWLWQSILTIGVKNPFWKQPILSWIRTLVWDAKWLRPLKIDRSLPTSWR